MGLFSEIARGILGNANAGGRISSDMKLISELAKTDRTTCKARGALDVLTEKGSHAYITKVTSRSAPQTRVFMGEPDEEAEDLARAAARYLETEKVGLLFIDRQMGDPPEALHSVQDSRHPPVCQAPLHVGQAPVQAN